MINRIKNNRTLAPIIMNIELTDYCPMKCKQCYKKQKYTNLDWLKFVELVNEAKEIGVKKILLSGGEPLCYPYLFEAISLIHEKHIFVCISSSGFGIDEIAVKKLKKSNIDIIYLSLNGSTKEINNLSRDGYDNILQAMINLQKAEVPFRINWVARSDNVDDFPNLIELCRRYGADGIDVLVNKPTINDTIESQVNNDQLYTLSEICKRESGYIGVQSCYTELADMVSENKNSFFSGCLAGKASMAVFASGSFSICPHVYSSHIYANIMDFWNTCSRVCNNGLCRLNNR